MKMYAITHINKDGMRVLSFANQGRNHFATKKKAQIFLENMFKNNSESSLLAYYGFKGKVTLEIREVDCYDNGDAKGIYFNQ